MISEGAQGRLTTRVALANAYNWNTARATSMEVNTKLGWEAVNQLLNEPVGEQEWKYTLVLVVLKQGRHFCNKSRLIPLSLGEKT